MLKSTIKKGDTAGTWLVGHRTSAEGAKPVVWADLSAGYNCKIAVAGTAIERTITDLNNDNSKFLVTLTPTETDTLTAGQKYEVGIQLENLSLVPAFRKEVQINLNVGTSIVSNI